MQVGLAGWHEGDGGCATPGRRRRDARKWARGLLCCLCPSPSPSPSRASPPRLSLILTPSAEKSSQQSSDRNRSWLFLLLIKSVYITPSLTKKNPILILNLDIHCLNSNLELSFIGRKERYILWRVMVSLVRRRSRFGIGRERVLMRRTVSVSTRRSSPSHYFWTRYYKVGVQITPTNTIVWWTDLPMEGVSPIACQLVHTHRMAFAV